MSGCIDSWGTRGLETRFATVMAELFANVEINREPRWQILSKLAVASLIFHATVLASLIYVPAVRDMFNIAALLSDTGYVERHIQKLRLAKTCKCSNCRREVSLSRRILRN